MGAEDLAQRVQEEGFTDFDVAIAAPDMMPVVGRLGRILGPQGKMPNPRVGTVTDDIGTAVRESKAGKTEYRTDRTAIVHLPIGKTDFDERTLLENYAAVLDEMVRAKPAAAKGRYLRTITLATTMGPGVRVDPTRTRNVVEDAPAASLTPVPHARDPGGGLPSLGGPGQARTATADSPRFRLALRGPEPGRDQQREPRPEGGRHRGGGDADTRVPGRLRG